ncbi:uncharacterized protein J4E78_000152 [Alternaria triticimaculans]|uniref:uncharacterized protein n=1 Tax=Alternaria triticimaculans TaxID=297637 RepID=UPI0020C39CC9|nr:uncharacterized protein J4E78_000152 [Alternaria triticimaculans]KAI4671656.1 hypothetical protein J4E78_000152 [Alternaria triticimaculans]
MAKDKPSALLALPAELRLQIYSNLLTETLENGRTSDVGALYLASRTTYSEMKPLVSTVQVALDLKRAWDHSRRLRGEVRGRLCFQIPSSHTYINPLTEFAITAPRDRKRRNPVQRTKHNMLRRTEDFAVFGLRLLLCPFGFGVERRYTNKQLLASSDFFFRTFYQIWGKEFLEKARLKRYIDRLTFQKDSHVEDRFIVKIVHGKQYGGVYLPASGAFYGPWCFLTEGSTKRLWGVDFRGGLKLPGWRHERIDWFIRGSAI